MIDLKTLRENPDQFKRRIAGRLGQEDVDELLRLDASKRELQKKVEELRAAQKRASGPEEGKKIKKARKALESEFRELSSQLDERLAGVPNVPDPDVPAGRAENNKIIRETGVPDKSAGLPHWDIGSMLGIIDFETASSIASSFWPLLLGDGARLEASLLNFFMDENDSAGFVPMVVPYLVNASSAFGTGQLPKFAGDLYKTQEDGLYLIPTGEVPAGNLYKNRIIDASRLPLKFQIPSPCFRKEAGSWGKLGKGLIRNHQFHKVEIFEYVRPEDSPRALEEMTSQVSAILSKLGLAHRIVLLASQDMGFSAAKTYDVEVWMRGMGTWLEVSSCSNCRDFQARRTGTRCRESSGEIFHPHTLNASAVAVGRVFAALCENGWDGSGVVLPECLRAFMKKDRLEK